MRGINCFLLTLVLIPLSGFCQGLELRDDIFTVTGLTNQQVTLGGRCELRITGTGDPLPGSIINLDSQDAWIVFLNIKPSDVAGSLLNRIKVFGSSAVLNQNVRVTQFGQGTVVIPHGADFLPLEVFEGKNFMGRSAKLKQYTAYNSAALASVIPAIRSFKLKRGYMATFAQNDNGTGASRCYIAQDGDLEVGVLPSQLDSAVRFIRVFQWRWVSKKGIAGDIESGLNVHWLYNWANSRDSTLDWEYVPIRQNRWWPSVSDTDWKKRGSTHLLGYNEPDRPDQANLSVDDAIGGWGDLLVTGLRVGAPAVSDGGLNWLYSFIDRADSAGLRVDFVPVHYYRCYGNPADAAGTAQQFYNFLKGVYDRVRRPLWVTEWNNGANWTSCADPTFAQQQAAVKAIIDMLDNTPFVERYAIYNWVEDVRRVKWDDGSLTAAGETYRDQKSPLGYIQEIPGFEGDVSAWLTFDGTSQDITGNGFNAMLAGTPSFVPGKTGMAIALDGVNDYIQLPANIGNSNRWSFACWVLWNGGNNWQRIFDFGEYTSNYMFLTPKSGNNTLRFTIYDGNTEQQINTASLTPGVWTHIAVTISNNVGKIFINGLPVATNTALTLTPLNINKKYNYLGKSQYPADPLFNGRLDDVRIYNRALSDAEVSKLAAAAFPQVVSSTIVLPDAAINQQYKASISALVYGGSGVLNFSKAAGPSWLTIFSNGNMIGTPRDSDAGTNRFLIRIADTNGFTNSVRLEIRVSPVFECAISSSADDAEESASGSVNLTSTDLELVNDSASGAGDQIVGLRFSNVEIPQGAIIREAIIQFAADESQSEITQLLIQTEASDYSMPFATNKFDISSRPRSRLSVLWTPPPWTAGETNLNQRTPNLAGILQEVVSRPGWKPGNALSFIITGKGHRTADSFDKSGGIPARLVVNYTTPTPLYTVSSTIISSANDAEEGANGAVNLTSTDLELIKDSSAGNQTVGLRFENVPVPAGAILRDAYIQFTADETQTELTAVLIRAQASDNAPVFTTNVHNISSRPVTESVVRWTIPAWNQVGESGTAQRTPDISPLINEVIARPGWKAGNAMAFIITGLGHRTADSFDKIGGSPPVLVVNFYLEPPVGSYMRWASNNVSLIFQKDDADGDGYDNLLEYALGMNPLKPDFPPVQLLPRSGQMTFSYKKPVEVLDVIYQVEWSDEVESGVWTTPNNPEIIISDDGKYRTIQTTIPSGTAGKRFVRLKVAKE